MKTELYIIIAVLFLLTVIMIWWGVKTFLDIRRRQKEWKRPHQPHLRRGCVKSPF